MDNKMKEMMLRYAQLIFKRQKNKAPLSDEEEEEIKHILQETGLPHEVILQRVAENLIDKM